MVDTTRGDYAFNCDGDRTQGVKNRSHGILTRSKYACSALSFAIEVDGKLRRSSEYNLDYCEIIETSRTPLQ